MEKTAVELSNLKQITVVGIVLAFVLVGFVVLFVVWVRAIYRVVKGWLKLNDNQPVVPA
jgi:uncharacterized membrane protein